MGDEKTTKTSKATKTTRSAKSSDDKIVEADGSSSDSNQSAETVTQESSTPEAPSSETVTPKDSDAETVTPEAPSSETAASNPNTKTPEQLAAEVWRGEWGGVEERKARLTKAGHNADTVLTLVDRGVGRGHLNPGAKSVSQLADEVIRGDWGNDAEKRKRRLTAAGYSNTAVQAEIDSRVSNGEEVDE